MAKTFNIAGSCIPGTHYMADVSKKPDRIRIMIFNGEGFDFKEVQISDEKRMDVVITFKNKKYIVELKIWRGESYHQNGIEQLCDYLERQNQNTGYLLTYDLRKQSGKVGEWERIKNRDKVIFSAWV
jgi:hypothetical protein